MKNSTVLFVDDEPALLEGLRLALRKEPYEILTAESSTAGMDMLHEHDVDVVVSDEQMPGVSGSEFLAFVRERFPETVRIMLTGQASLEAAIQAINEGEVYRFLTKPVNPLVLSQTLREGLMMRDLKCEAARLLGAHRKQRRALEELERLHPGLTSVLRDDEGCIVLESIETADLLRELRCETGGRGAGDVAFDPAHGTR